MACWMEGNGREDLFVVCNGSRFIEDRNGHIALFENKHLAEYCAAQIEAEGFEAMNVNQVEWEPLIAREKEYTRLRREARGKQCMTK